MADSKKLKMISSYAGCKIVLTTQHSKAFAVSPVFKKKLGAFVTENVIDTDILGTFSGEIERQGNALSCARLKCELGLENSDVEYALASEGSFAPHPACSFVYCDFEILYFIDVKRDFHLHISDFTTNTNYAMKEIETFQDLESFAYKVKFPSHALIIRPNIKNSTTPIFKGVNTHNMLKKAFDESIKLSIDGKVWVETDMRAHLNPLRMKFIGQLAEKLADRLASHCPKCKIPGWGQVRIETGLECSWCRYTTDLIKSEIFGCVKCDYEEIVPPSHGLYSADPGHCLRCNP